MRSAKKGIAHSPPQRADLRKLHAPGHVDNVPDRAAHRLARAIHDVESDSAILSWSAQERAETLYNTRGLAATLDEAARLERILRERHDAIRQAKAPERHERRKAAGLASDPKRPRCAWDCDALRDASDKGFRLSMLPYRETPDGSPVADVIGYEGPRSGTWNEHLITEGEARERLAFLLDHYAVETAHVYDTRRGLVVAEWTHADEQGAS